MEFLQHLSISTVFSAFLQLTQQQLVRNSSIKKTLWPTFKLNSQIFSFGRFFEFHVFSLVPVSDSNNYFAGITNNLFEALNHFCLRSCAINLSPPFSFLNIFLMIDLTNNTIHKILLFNILHKCNI
ncbi:hypothetical protein P9112_004228 [Eukaryota sp. TZLM1-RC]